MDPPSINPNDPHANRNNYYPANYQSSNLANASYNSNQNAFGFGFDNAFGDDLSPFQQPASWSQTPMRPPSASGSTNAPTGMSYTSQFQQQPPQQRPYMMNQASYNPSSNGQFQHTGIPYGVPIDPALTYRASPVAQQQQQQQNLGIPISQSPSMNMNSMSNPQLQLPPTTISPHALQNRQQPYRNPTSQSPTPSLTPRPGSSLGPRASMLSQEQQKNFVKGPESIQSPGQAPVQSPMTPSTKNATISAVVIEPRHLGVSDLPDIPPSVTNGSFQVLDMRRLERDTDSREILPFVTLSNATYQLKEVKANVPKWVDRLSKNEIRKLHNDGKITSLPGRMKTEKKTTIKVPKKVLKPLPPGSKESPKMVSLSESSSSESEESEYESESEDELTAEVSPNPPTRPEDPIAGAKYDTINAVWFPKNEVPSGPEVRSAVLAYSELVKGYRDGWKQGTTKLQEAEEKKEPLAKFKAAVARKRSMMETALKATLEHGHPAYLEKFGNHPVTMSVFYSFIKDRHDEGDYDGSLIVEILKAMTQFTTLDEEMLEKTKNNKILSRLVKKGGEEVKTLAQKVLDNAVAATKSKSEAAKAGATSGTVSGVTNTKPAEEKGTDLKRPAPKSVVTKLVDAKGQDALVAKRAPETVAGVKRPREADSSLPSQKRTVVPSTQQRKPGEASKVIPPGKKSGQGPESKTVTSNSSAPAAKAKVPATHAKPAVNLFASLSSASKKPGTSNAALAAAAKQKASVAKENKPMARPTSPPAHTSTFSLSETLAHFNEPKKSETSKKVESIPNETEEEKKKRLRKEQRRRLRVSFKPDDELVQIRLFRHDPDEEISSGDVMMRDVDDIGGEGRMLKLHKDLEIDDDEANVPGEQSVSTWLQPSGIDFKVIDHTERERNFIPRGGVKEPKSEEKTTAEEREKTTLMVFYSSPSDIPPTPREPPDEFEPAAPIVKLGEPSPMIRGREAQVLAARNFNRAPSQSYQAPPVAAPIDINALLARINQNQAAQPQTPATFQYSTQQPVQQNATQLSFLERTFGQFSQQNQAASQQPVVAPQQPVGQPLDLQRILAGIKMQNQNLQPTPVPQPAPAPSNQLPAEVDRILTSFRVNQGQQPPTQAAGYSSNYGYGNNEGDRKRNWETSDGSREQEGGYTGGKRQKGGYKGANHKKGTVACKYWQDGKCAKGSDCTYRHD